MRSTVMMTAFVLLAAPAAADPSLKGWSGPKPKTPCLCRHAGGKARLGETICRMRGGAMVTLRCELVLNNTSWTEVAKGCKVAARGALPLSAGRPAPL